MIATSLLLQYFHNVCVSEYFFVLAIVHNRSYTFTKDVSVEITSVYDKLNFFMKRGCPKWRMTTTN